MIAQTQIAVDMDFASMGHAFARKDGKDLTAVAWMRKQDNAFLIARAMADLTSKCSNVSATTVGWGMIVHQGCAVLIVVIMEGN